MKRTEEKYLFRLFKKEFNKPENLPVYEEADWKAMEQLLDKNKKKGARMYWILMLGSVAAMLLVVFGWWFFTDVNLQQKQKVVKQLASKTDMTKKNNDAATSTSSEETYATSQNEVVSNKRNDLTVIKPFKSTNRPVPVNEEIDGSAKATTVLLQASQSVVFSSYPDPSLLPVHSRNIYRESKDTLSDHPQSKIANEEVMPADLGSTKSKIPPLTLSIVASPDLNSINLLTKTKMGVNAGLLLSVGLTKKLSLSTGVIYAIKPYTSSFDEYHTRYNFPVTPQSVTADCRVLDVPLNLNYEIFHQTKNKISISSGLSSYFMLRENYHFNYADPNHPGPNDYNISNSNKHLLGILNIGATYQRQLNPKLNIGIQPYIKMPLTKIGYGETKLRSAGIAVNLSWNLNSSNKP